MKPKNDIITIIVMLIATAVFIFMLYGWFNCGELAGLVKKGC